jgi:protein-disulfide isomerase
MKTSLRKFYIPLLLLPILFFGAGCGKEDQAEIVSPSLGRDGAPLQLTVWFDFQCPACKTLEESVMRFVIEDYVNTGKAKITYKNMAFIGKESVEAANAAFCAHEAGGYKVFHDKIFERQNGENQGVFTKNMLAIAAADVNLGISNCIEANKYRGRVLKETEEAVAQGIKWTPTVFLNGKMMKPISTYLQMKQALDDELAAARKK